MLDYIIESVAYSKSKYKASGLEAKICWNPFLELIYLLCNFPELNIYKYLRVK